MAPLGAGSAAADWDCAGCSLWAASRRCSRGSQRSVCLNYCSCFGVGNLLSGKRAGVLAGGDRGHRQVRSYIPNPKLDRACRRSRTAPPGPTLATAGPSPAAALDERCRPLQDGCGDAMHAAGAVLRLRSLLVPAAGSDGLALAAAAGACLAQNMAAIYRRPLSASTVPIGYQAASRGPRARGLVMGPRYIPSGLFLSRRLLR